MRISITMLKTLRLIRRILFAETLTLATCCENKHLTVTIAVCLKLFCFPEEGILFTRQIWEP